jgi:hypothetical protein
MSEPSFVYFQSIELSDSGAKVNSFPAVITSRRQVPAPVDPNAEVTDPPVEPKLIEAVNLTVFIDGGFEYYKDVTAYDASAIPGPSSYSFRAIDTEAPKIELKEPSAGPAAAPSSTFLGTRIAPAPKLSGKP